MLNSQKTTQTDIVGPVTKLVILLGLSVWAFWPELTMIVSTLPRSSELAHAAVAPVAILLLIYQRRRALIENLTKGSLFGVVVLIAGIGLYAVATWPFSYGYVRNIAMIPVFAAVILAACGWRVLKLSVPMLLLLLLSIPIGPRLYASLIIRPETYTIAATATALDWLPGINTWVEGVDVFFSSAQNVGAVALGESNRGARLLLALALVGVFVTFSQIRSLGRLVTVAIAAAPIVLFCNFLRFFCWGLIATYSQLGPASALPRNIAVVCSLFAAYVLFVIVCSFKLNLFIKADEDQHNTAAEGCYE